MKVSVIIPAYNEADSIGNLIQSIKDRHPDYEIIVINDGSTDGTAETAEKSGATIVNHPYNMGNGAAVKSGIRHARGETLVFMDGDGQHDPDEIERLLKYLPEYDMVVGARKTGGQASLGRMTGNMIFNLLASYVAKFKVDDLTSGFRAVKAEIAQNLLYLLPNTYSYPTTLTLSVLRSGRTLKYVPIKVERRNTGKSNIKPLRDSVRFFMIIVKICTLFSPFRVFLPVSAGIFTTGLLYYLYTFTTQGRFTNMSALLFSTSIVIFMMGLISEQVSQMRYENSEGTRQRSGFD
jgi:glycosyltransferase involved in cell wall biosynthesis